MKPFPICRRWAFCVLDEFFLQGDKEKELGITVQPLNDRDKVNRPYSQIGFIEFLVSPLVIATVKVLHPIEECAEQLMRNLYHWQTEWVSTTDPVPDQEEQAKVRDRITCISGKYGASEWLKTLAGSASSI